MDLRKIPLIWALLFLSACSIEAQISDLFKSPGAPKLPPGIDIPLNPGVIVIEDPEEADFLRSNIYVGSHGVADGTPLQFIIRLMNSDGSVVAGHTPDFSVVSGTSVTKGSCSPSDRYGISFCSLSSTQPGVKVIQLENAKDQHPTQRLVFNGVGVEETDVGGGPGGPSNESADLSGTWKFTGVVGDQFLESSSESKGYRFILDSKSDIQ